MYSLHAIGNGVEDGLALDRGTVLERDGVGSVELSVHDGVLGGSVVAILVGAPAQGCARLAVPHDEVLVLAALLDIARTKQLVRIGAEEEHGIGPVLQEVLVIELLANDVVHPGKTHQAIGVGIGLQPLIGLPGLGDADGIHDDELRGIGLVDRRASRDDAPEGRLGCIGLLAALAPVDNRVRLLWGCRHHGFDGHPTMAMLSV